MLKIQTSKVESIPYSEMAIWLTSFSHLSFPIHTVKHIFMPFVKKCLTISVTPSFVLFIQNCSVHKPAILFRVKWRKELRESCDLMLCQLTLLIINRVASGDTPSLNLCSQLRERLASCSLTPAAWLAWKGGMTGCLGPYMPLMQKLTNTSVCQHLGETFDKPKDPFSNSESFRKGEKTTLASDWLTICTERQSVKLAWMTPNCSHFSHLEWKGKWHGVSASYDVLVLSPFTYIISLNSHYSSVKGTLLFHFRRSKVNSGSSPPNL